MSDWPSWSIIWFQCSTRMDPRMYNLANYDMMWCWEARAAGGRNHQHHHLNPPPWICIWFRNDTHENYRMRRRTWGTWRTWWIWIIIRAITNNTIPRLCWQHFLCFSLALSFNPKVPNILASQLSNSLLWSIFSLVLMFSYLSGCFPISETPPSRREMWFYFLPILPSPSFFRSDYSVLFIGK